MKTSPEHRQNIPLFATSNPTHRTSLMFVIICIMALGLYSCGEDSTGAINGNGNGIDNGNGNGTEIGTEPTFTNVSQIFQSHCAPCHTSQATNGVQLNTYNNVMGSEGAQYGNNVVIPENADDSPLVDKIEPNPQHGVRMPQGGPYLSNDRIDQIKEWINDGAEDN